MTDTDTQAARPAANSVLTQGGLEVISIAKSYDKRAVLTDISLSVAKGEVLGLLGPNGAGKTTLMQVAAAQIHPSSGVAAVLDEALEPQLSLPLHAPAAGVGHNERSAGGAAARSRGGARIS